MSRACMNAGSKNVHCQSALQRELSQLEKERDRQLKNLRHDAKQLLQQHPVDRSPSPPSGLHAAAATTRAERVRSAGQLRTASATQRDRPRNAGADLSPRGSPSRAHKSPSAAGSPSRAGKSPSKAGSPSRAGGKSTSPAGSPSRAGGKSPSPAGSPSRAGGKSPRAAGRPSSPAALLPRRKSMDVGGNDSSVSSQLKASALRHAEPHVFVTQFGSNVMLPVSTEVPGAASSFPDPHAKRPCSGVPQIIVSDEADQGLREGGSSGEGGRKTSTHHTGSSTSEEDEEKEDGEPELSQSLNLPVRRSRSNSMPSVIVLPSIFKPPPRRPSYCPPPAASSDLSVPESPRARSHSFSGIVPVRRRGSVSEQWGSISERNRPTMGNLRGRRGSVDMKNMLRDLMYGVEHKELMDPKPGAPSVSDRQWEQLKKCRYLRQPSRDNSDEDLSEDDGK